MGWRKIESAPKDGTQFQAWVVSERCTYGSWEPFCRYNEDGAFQIYGRIDYDMEGWDVYLHLTPTHWMPLPPPPKE